MLVPGCQQKEVKNNNLQLDEIFKSVDEFDRGTLEYAELADSAFAIDEKINAKDGMLKASLYKGRYYYAIKDYEKS